MGTGTKTVHMAEVRQRLVAVVRTSVQEAATAASQAAPILEDLVQRAELAAEAVAGSGGRGAVRSSREVAGYLVQVRGSSRDTRVPAVVCAGEQARPGRAGAVPGDVARALALPAALLRVHQHDEVTTPQLLSLSIL